MTYIGCAHGSACAQPDCAVCGANLARIRPVRVGTVVFDNPRLAIEGLWPHRHEYPAIRRAIRSWVAVIRA